nr:hypothetical protein [Lachnospiraceae bacterium]
LPFAGKAVIVAKELSESFEGFINSEEAVGKTEVILRAFEENDVTGMCLVLACTDDLVINKTITKISRDKGIPANNCSDKNDCDFYFPGLIYKEPFTVGITASGEAHKLVKKIREKTEEVIDEVLKK